MPKIHFTSSVLQKIRPVDGKGAWYSDTETKGLQLWVGGSGKNTWYIHYRRHDKKLAYYKIGDAEYFSVQEARTFARNFLTDLSRGGTPWIKPEIPLTEVKLTLGEFIDRHYGPWVEGNRRSGIQTTSMIKTAFQGLLRLPTEELTVDVLEDWIQERRSDGLKASSINRQVTSIRAALNWGVKRGILKVNNMTRLEHLREEDSRVKVRYLLPEERERLYMALDARSDYLKPMVIVSLNTGIRRGTLFQLMWSDVDFREEILTVRPNLEKSGKLVRIPMNKELTEALKAWRSQSSGEGLVFPSPRTGEMMDNCKRTWAGLLKAAEIQDFRWHDMRHDFASQLVMAGVDLNTVRELMGHSDMKMTLKYAHLAPQVKKAAVELLGRK